MVEYVKARKENAQKTKNLIREKNVFNSDYPVKKKGNHIFFPVTKKIDGLETVDLKAKKREKKPTSLKEALSGSLSEKEFDSLVSSFDVLGDIAIIEVYPELKEKKELIGRALLETHKNIKTVLQKKTGRSGVYRTLTLDFIAGEDKRETIYKEHGVRLKLDVEKVYFSPRLSEERRRISELVKPGEKIAGLFAGVGPFPLVIARKKQCVVYAVELNPVAVDYMKKNIELNKNVLKGKVMPIQGDVKKIAGKIPECNRVLMPLPKGGEDFLDSALAVCADEGVIHFYQFASDEDLYSPAIKKIRAAAEKTDRNVRVLNKKVVRPYAPRVSQVVIDFEVFS